MASEPADEPAEGDVLNETTSVRQEVPPQHDTAGEQAGGRDVQVSMLSSQPSFNYMEAMAGFMGVIEAPKAADPALQAELALDFLNTMWQVCEVSKPDLYNAWTKERVQLLSMRAFQEQEHSGAEAGGQQKTAYEETAHQLAGQVNVPTIAPGKSVFHSVINFYCASACTVDWIQ